MAHLRSDGEVFWTHSQRVWPGGRAGAPRKPHVHPGSLMLHEQQPQGGLP